jgi:hypothetical protein
MTYKYHKHNKIDIMMVDIVVLGKKEVWESIEDEKNAFKRIEKRKLFTKALRKLAL